MTEKNSSGLDYVMPVESDPRRAILLPLLGNQPPRSPSTERDTIEALPQPPDKNPEVRFNYSFNELEEITNELTPGTPDDLKRVTRYALIWSGMKVDEELTRWVTTDHGYEEHTRLPRVTLPVHNKRLSVRVVPDSWEDRYDTPFRLQRGKEGNQISAFDVDGNETIIANPTHRYVTESVQTIAYGKDQRDGTKNITINPYQKCPQRCEFCCRGYHNMTAERKDELINLSPDEMARYLKAKFPKQDWEQVSGLTIVTGDFRNEQAVLDYVDGLVGSMREVTDGKWDPTTNDQQDIVVSTHLLRSREAMEEAKKLGMRRFMYTAELADDASRQDIMYVKKGTGKKINKGETSFAGALAVLETAVDVFGADNVEPVLVVGLDPLEKTKQSMDRLNEMGIRRVSRALLNIYQMNQFSLPRSNFKDAVKGMQYAKDLFDSAHTRVVNGDNQAATARELFT